MSIASTGFSLAAVAFLLLTVLLALNYRRKPALRGLLLASAGTAIWALALLASFVTGREGAAWVWPLDGLHSAVWLVFLSSLLPRSNGAGLRKLLPLASLGALGLLALAPWMGMYEQSAVQAPAVVLLAMALLGIWTTEQVYRNADLYERHVLKPLCFAIGGLLAFDMFVYSHALLLSDLDGALWASRSFVTTVIVVPMLVSARRHPELIPHVYISRQLVFHSATLVGAGAYLAGMGVVGYLIRLQGGQWSVVLQATFFAAALLTLSFILSSSQLRARFRVFLSKHFYRYRYEYRDEWLRLIATLSDKHGGDAPQRALKALADILHSRTGQLWVSAAQGERYETVATMGPKGVDAYSADDPLIKFLVETNWVVDSEEYRSDPELYSHALREVAPEALPAASVIVPVRHEDRLLGLARLEKPPGLSALNYEDHDLLKTVGRQMAIFVEQELVRERLAETRQFEAFNRMTAFLMHDLKNVLAQQALIVQNAPRFKHKPEFIDDTIATIESSVARMRKLLVQLQRRTTDSESGPVDLAAVVQQVVEQSAGALPVPSLSIEGASEVHCDMDRLAMVVANAIRNAQDATPAHGKVEVRVSQADDAATIEVIDTGAGMDEAFVRERLFRPFDTTKAGTGMGIGAYQIREYITSLGGRVSVDSQPGNGTRLMLVIPCQTPSAGALGNAEHATTEASSTAADRQ